mgnify:CR=1 FL=1
MATTISSPTSVTPTTGNANRAFANDGLNTSFFNSTSTDTEYSGFSGLSIPSGATINGIEVIIDATSNSVPLATSVNNGSSYSANKATNGLPGKSFATIDPCWGSSSDLWGLSWTPATAAAIVLRFDWSTMTSGRVIAFDHIQIRVTFTAAASATVHSVNTVAEANIAAIKGVAHANIAEVNTVTFD